MRILVVEDDDILRAVLTRQLSEQHYAIDLARDGLQGWEYATTYEYDLLILDLVMPRLDGITLCQKLRQAGYTLPILMLTAQDTSNAKTMGFEAGADDYVVKPFDEAELIARVRALLRRSSTNPQPILTWYDLWLNTTSQEVSYGGELLDLTSKEYAMLEMMMRDSQHVFSKEEMLNSLWSSAEFPVESTIRSHMRRLRHKLVSIGAPADLIATSHGRGYFLKPPTSATPVLETDQLQNLLESSLPPQQQTQYLEFLNQTWQSHRSQILERVQKIRSAIQQIQTNSLTSEMRADTYHLAHTLSGTLGTFGLPEAMQIARKLEQEFHPDIAPEPYIERHLQLLIDELQEHIEATTALLALPTILGSNTETSRPNVRVMLVDDDPSLLQILPKQLQSHGFQVTTLDDPQQFWTVLEGIHPDVLILDVQMPQISGIKICRKLRSSDNWQKLPVMFLSMFADAQTQHQAFAAGADDYLCKPITAENLSDRIRQRLQRIRVLSK
jgi:DNA-binding response OmpR family regulator/HPt (histidine-containing phosphotransfer) domain-containing protein